MKKIKNYLVFSLLLIAVPTMAQKRGPVKERMDAMKIGFLTNRLDLSPEEAKVFWPVYNKYSDELDQLRKGRRENIINARDNFDEMTDAEIEKAVDSEIIFRSNEVDILKKYHPQFKKILPVKKVAMLYKAEEDFKRKLLEMIKDHRGEDGRRLGPPDGDGPH